MIARSWALMLPFALLTQIGCVERRYIVTTSAIGSPPGSPDLGAMVFNEKGLPVSASPADSQFVYYGKYRFTAIKDGYQTKVQEEQFKTPWYEYFPLDFISENVIPWTIKDIRHIHIVMEPMQPVPPEVLLDKAGVLRQRGQSEGPRPVVSATSNLPKMPAAK